LQVLLNVMQSEILPAKAFIEFPSGSKRKAAANAMPIAPANTAY
jgi:hypothetical protein